MGVGTQRTRWARSRPRGTYSVLFGGLHLHDVRLEMRAVGLLQVRRARWWRPSMLRRVRAGAPLARPGVVWAHLGWHVGT